jgi:hypothetical protein
MEKDKKERKKKIIEKVILEAFYTFDGERSLIR